MDYLDIYNYEVEIRQKCYREGKPEPLFKTLSQAGVEVEGRKNGN